MNSRISSHPSYYQPALGKLGERLFNSLGLPLDVLIQQPPLNDTFQCILRVGVGVQISKDLIRHVRLTSLVAARVQSHSFAPRAVATVAIRVLVRLVIVTT